MELNRIYNENCIKTLERMPDDFLDMTLTSPPYDNLRSYNGYEFPLEAIIKLLYHVPWTASSTSRMSRGAWP